MRHESDYFQPMHDLEREAKIFCSHKDAHSWFHYENDRTIKSVFYDNTHDTITQELNAIYNHLMTYADDLLNRLESYENYETCKLVTTQFRKLEADLGYMQAKHENLNI